MTSRYSRQGFRPLLWCFFIAWLPLLANGTSEESIEEKRIKVAMRMIGHKVLMSQGDTTSRVLPIKKVGHQYRILFEHELGFDPDTIVSIVREVISKGQVASSHLVEVEQCESEEVVYCFEIRDYSYADIIPCSGRLLPRDCYHLLITILNTANPYTNGNSYGYALSGKEAKQSRHLRSVYLVIPLLFLIGFIGYAVKKKTPANPTSDLISIGAMQFDPKNEILSFKDQKIELSGKEAALLTLLHASANLPVERPVILQKVWGDEGDYIGRTLDVFISRLRKKLAVDTSLKIVNIRGVGYKLIVDGLK